MTLIPLTDCCVHLGVDPKTLRCWLKAAQLAACLHPSDARIKCLTDAQLAQVARLHERHLPDPAELAPDPTAHTPASSPSAASELATLACAGCPAPVSDPHLAGPTHRPCPGVVAASRRTRRSSPSHPQTLSFRSSSRARTTTSSPPQGDGPCQSSPFASLDPGA